MKFPSLSLLAGLVVVFGTGCAAEPPTPAPCPAQYSFHYTDTARGISLCLPPGLKKSTADGLTTFTGFSVPAGTNLQAKTLIIATGEYDGLTGATPSGSLKVGGIVLQRAQLEDGSAGHVTLHVIYTWQTKGQPVHFDFTHRAVNVMNYDPPNRPKEYDRAAQIKMTEEIMRTLAVERR